MHNLTYNIQVIFFDISDIVDTEDVILYHN